jgi:hypothetical protein
MTRDQLPPHKGATYVLPRWKVVYVSVSKAACTSIKWMLAGLQGEDPKRFYRAVNREVSRALTIHTRPLWRHTPMLHELSDAELAEISPENGWFTFTAVRHPSGRLWSAWQSKLLLRDPKWVARAGEAPWFPRVPETSGDVVEDFHRFVRAVETGEAEIVMADRHFRLQSDLAAPDRMPYTRIYDIRELPAMLDELAAHLRTHGWDGSLALRPANDTPLRPLATVFTPEIRASIRRVYAPDFAAFDYDDDIPDRFDASGEYGEASLREVARLAERNERIGDLARIAKRLEESQNGRRDGALVRKVRRRVAGALRRT